MNLSELDPTVYECAAASVLKAEEFRMRIFTADDSEPFCCWAITTAAAGFQAEVNDDEPHLQAFLYLFSPNMKGGQPAYFWGDQVTKESQQEHAIALLLMADIVRSEQRPTRRSASAA